jgi:hypothetical protein
MTIDGTHFPADDMNQTVATPFLILDFDAFAARFQGAFNREWGFGADADGRLRNDA